jgi:hypothetical protein
MLAAGTWAGSRQPAGMVCGMMSCIKYQVPSGKDKEHLAHESDVYLHLVLSDSVFFIGSHSPTARFRSSSGSSITNHITADQRRNTHNTFAEQHNAAEERRAE